MRSVYIPLDLRGTAGVYDPETNQVTITTGPHSGTTGSVSATAGLVMGYTVNGWAYWSLSPKSLHSIRPIRRPLHA